MSFLRLIYVFATIIFLSKSCLGQLTAESVARRPCTQRTPFLQANLAFVYSPLVNWYVNYGSQHLFRSYATVFLGQPPANETQLNSMNFRVAITGNIITNTGFGNLFFQQTCVQVLTTNNLFNMPVTTAMSWLLRANCTPIAATASNSNMDLNSMNPSDDTLLWTDNASVLVISRCVGPYGAQSEDWKILSTTPTIEPTLLSTIITKLNSMGFDTTGY